jgi:phytol kinase
MPPLLLNGLKIFAVIACTAALMAGLAVYQRRRSPHPEWARKLMHMGSGLIALALPWLFSETWPVIVLALLASGGMFALKYVRRLRSGLGAVTGSVVRSTLGEVWFPLGAGTVFALSGGDKLLYSIPILILTFADASAALIGIFYGVYRYTASDGPKTLEGSLAFFQTAFLSALIPILLFTEIGRTETLLISLLMGLLSMLLDAMAWQGLDNLLIPVLSFLLLRAFVNLDAAVLLAQFAVTLAMIAFVIFWRKRTTLNDSALMGTVVYGYVCWTLGGWAWVLPPLLLFLIYNTVSSQDAPRSEPLYSAPVMLGVGAAGLFWLIWGDILNRPSLFFPFLLSFATQLAMIRSSRPLRAGAPGRAHLLLARSVVMSWAIYVLPYMAVTGWTRHAWIYPAAGLLAIGSGAALFAASQMGPDGYRNTAPRWLIQTLCAGLASVFGFAAVQLV